MAKRLGRFGQLQLTFDGGGSWSYMTSIVDMNLDTNTDEVDVTTHDSNGFREYIANLTDGQFSLNVMYDDQSPSQARLQQAVEEKTNFRFRYQPVVQVGTDQIEGAGFITAASRAAPLDGMQTIDITVRVTGQTLRSPQT